jgi:hypothetical protein
MGVAFRAKGPNRYVLNFQERLDEDASMRPEEHIRLAKSLSSRLRGGSVEIGPPGRSTVVRGVDPNELKKLYTFLLKHRDLTKLRKLIEKLPRSPFAKRSGSTEGYYKNIQSCLGSEFYGLQQDDAIAVLGWVCRLLSLER